MRDGTMSYAAWAALTLLLWTSLGCGYPDPAGRVLVIGIDGAAPRVMADLLERGELVHLQAIAEAGVWGTLRSERPLVSPRIWNSVATGVVARRHGIVSFARKDAAGINRLFLSTDRRMPALWTIASAAGRRVGVVNWWNTYPPERVDGAMVSDHLFAGQVEDRRYLSGGVVVEDARMVHPEDLEPRLGRLLATREPPVDFANPFAGEALPEFVSVEGLSERYRQDGLVVRLALEVQEGFEPDLLMVLLTGIDRVSHVLWGALEDPELYPEEVRIEGEARVAAARSLERYYAYTDALIGVLLEPYEEDDLVIVLSDHGFEAGMPLPRLTGTHESEAAQDGVIFVRGRGVPSGRRVHGTTIFDVAPTVLAWMGLPVASDMDGRVAVFLQEEDVEQVESYSHLEPDHAVSDGTGAESVLLEQLRALGYVD
jgi:predicted AlkP superfamily phosphohydrolase/phosphomutase